MHLTRLILAASIALAVATSAKAEPLKIVTDIAPVQSLVAMITGEVAQPVALLPPGASPHSYALRPSEAASLADADVVIWMGSDLTPGLARSIDTLAKDGAPISLLELPDVNLLERRATVSFTEDDHEGHAHDSDHGHDHSDTSADPHAWLDPLVAAAWMQPIAKRLAASDPENGPRYMANAATAAQDLASLGDEINARLSPMRGQGFLVAHDFLQYFERRAGLLASGAVSDADAIAPGAARVRKIGELTADGAIRCMLVEPMSNRALVDQIAAQDGIRVAVADPLGLGLEPGPELYGQLIRRLADTIADCL
ncbi:MAG: zinc ABC transporter substrate-binding protein [Pseudomonadota bacterium]